MRIVHEINDNMQVGGGMHGSLVSMVMAEEGNGWDKEVIHFEGDLDSMYSAFRSAMDMLEGLKEIADEAAASR